MDSYCTCAEILNHVHGKQDRWVWPRGYVGDLKDEIQELAPLETALQAEDGGLGETVPVRLRSCVNEVGTLKLWCQSTRDPRRWKLEFNVRKPAHD